MADKIKLVRNDTRPSLVCTLTDETTGIAIGLTGATVRMKFRAAGDTTVRSNRATDPTSLAGDAGDYEGEIEITFQDGQIQTVYDLLKFKLREEF